MKHFLLVAVLFFLLNCPVSAAIQITPLPQPPLTAKLRVFVVVVTTELKSEKRPVSWLVSPEELDQLNKQAINNKLKQQGIYEVVHAADIQAVLGDQAVSSWEWMAGDWALAKNVGKALHADYVVLFERSFRLNLQFDMKLVNLNTGKQFETSGYIPSTMLRRLTKDQKKQAGAEVTKIHFRQLFQDAKSDLLQTAIQKGKVVAQESTSSSPVPLPTEKIQPVPDRPMEDIGLPPKEKPSPASSVPLKTKTTPKDSIPDRKNSEKQLELERELSKAFSAKDKKTDTPRLVVYDFDTAVRLKVVGLILTEALREELYNLGGFVLVNRENILKIMDEYKLQQTALVDEKQAVEVGKWLAANEAITGNLAILGNTSILQVKRVDIKTLGTVALGSLKCPAGREDELLDKMPELARKLLKSAE